MSYKDGLIEIAELEEMEKEMNPTKLYFEKVHGIGLEKGCGEIELSTFQNGGGQQYYFNKIDKAAAFAKKVCDSGIDIYSAVNLRLDRGAKKENVHYLTAFHTEIDFGTDGHKKPSEYETYDEALKAINDFEFEPTFLICSGGGFHSYHVLIEPVKVKEIGLNKLENVNKYLIQSLKADTGTHNINRSLRPTGTKNYKLPDNPRDVKVVISDGPLYDVDDFKPYMEPEEPENKVPESPNAHMDFGTYDFDDDLKALPISDKMKNLILHGNDGSYPSRSEADAAVVTALIHKGFEKPKICQLFYKYPIGEKFREQKKPEGYIDLTIKTAKAKSNLTESELLNPLFISGSITKNEKGAYNYHDVKFADYISEKYKLKYFELESAFFKYNGCCYEQFSKDKLNSLCQSELDNFRSNFTPAALKKFLHFSTAKCLIENTQAYDNQKRFLTLKNGLYDLHEEKLIPHDTEIFTTNLLPYEYDPSATCELWVKFLNDVMLGNKETITFIQQAVGYSFLKDIPTAALFLLIGEGSNGKSVFIITIQNLFGEENVANINLHQMSNEYYIQDLFGKMVNLSSESSHKKRIDTEIIKAAVAGDWISGRLPYKQPSKFKPYAKHFLSINTIPKNDDLTHGWERRIYPIEFNRVFSKEEADKQMSNKLSKELSGIFNWALEGYRSLRNKGYIFTESASIDQAKENYKNQSNSIYNFISMTLTKTDDDKVVFLKDIYARYKDFCNIEGEKNIHTKSEFKKALHTSGFKVNNSTKHGNAVCVFGAISR